MLSRPDPRRRPFWLHHRHGPQRIGEPPTGRGQAEERRGKALFVRVVTLRVVSSYMEARLCRLPRSDRDSGRGTLQEITQGISLRASPQGGIAAAVFSPNAAKSLTSCSAWLSLFKTMRVRGAKFPDGAPGRGSLARPRLHLPPEGTANTPRRRCHVYLGSEDAHRRVRHGRKAVATSSAKRARGATGRRHSR